MKKIIADRRTGLYREILVKDLNTLADIVRKSGVSRPSVKRYSLMPEAERYKVYPQDTGFAYVLYKEAFVHFCERQRERGFSKRGRRKKKKKSGPAKDTPNLGARRVKCPYCEGTGKDGKKTCKICKGKKRVLQRALDRIIKGVD